MPNYKHLKNINFPSDIKKGKATIISLLGYKNAVKYANKLKQNIYKKLRFHKKKANDLRETINFIMERNN